jgi:hypothetical protein
VEVPGGLVLVELRGDLSSQTPEFVIVTKRFNFAYAHPGSAGTVWAPAIEKAIAYYFGANNTYDSGTGSATEAYSVLNIPVQPTLSQIGSPTLSAWDTQVMGWLQSSQAVLIITNGSTTNNIVGDHEHVLLGVSTDASGNLIYTVRNPWGYQPGYTNVGGVFQIPASTFTPNFSIDEITDITVF